MAAGMDGSAAIRKLWLIPHSNSNKRRRKNANDAGIEASGARGRCDRSYEAEPAARSFLMEPDAQLRSEQTPNNCRTAGAFRGVKLRHRLKPILRPISAISMKDVLAIPRVGFWPATRATSAG